MSTAAPINNDFYNNTNDIWWGANSGLHLLRTSVNPCRLDYFKSLIDQFQINPGHKTVLEVGCGGGILTEEICNLGFDITAIDPSKESISHAVEHGAKQNLNIKYAIGFAEKLPYSDNSFDIVICCDVLEHVNDLSKSISEISRVLKPGGLFFYDTINRTLFSKLTAIKLAQDWKAFALMPKNFHVWEKFIKPKEMRELLNAHGMLHQQQKGTSPNIGPLKFLSLLRKRALGQLSYSELGEKFRFIKSRNKKGLYMGYAFKK